MSIDISLENADGYLLARVKGEWVPDAVNRELQNIASAAQNQGFTRVLIDARELSDSRNEFHRFLAGESIAEFLGPTVKAAAVYPEALINKFAENTAVNRGAQFIVLSDSNKAIGWLL